MKKKIMFLTILLVLSSLVTANTLKDGIESCFEFNENTTGGTDTADYFGNYTNGTIEGSMDMTKSGVFGKAPYFAGDGSLDVVSWIDGTFDILESSDWTMEFWLNNTVLACSSDDCYFWDHEGDNFNHFSFWLDNSRAYHVVGGDVMNMIGPPTRTANIWFQYIMKWNGSNNTMSVYWNGTLDNTSTLTDPFDATTGDYVLGAGIGGTREWLGQIDNVRVWNRGLSDVEISDSYNSHNSVPCSEFEYSGGGTPNNVSVVTITAPYDTDHLNDLPVNHTFNVSDSDSLVNITARTNGALRRTWLNVNTTGNTTFWFNFSAGQGNHSYNVEVWDGYNWTNTSVQHYIIDRQVPDWTIRTINPLNTTKIPRDTQSWILFNDSVDDTYLFAYNITVYYPNGSTWFSNQTINLNNSIYNFTYNRTITPTQPNGTYKIIYLAEDDHTKNLIKNYSYYIDNEGLWFSFEDYYITIRADTPSQVKTIGTTKLDDRYTFDFEYNNGQPSRTYRLQSSDTIYYRNNLYPYPVFVIGHNWVDFNVNETGVEYIVNKINDNEYNIEIKRLEPSDTDNIRSLGGLNLVNESYTFTINSNLAPVINTTTPTQNFSVNETDTINFTTTADDFDNDTLSYRYYLNGVNISSDQNISWDAPYNSHGINNITVIVSDTANKNDTYTWYVNVTHINLPPNVTSLTRSSGVWYANSENTYFICTGVDLDNETLLNNLTAEIDYRTNIMWHNLSAVNNGTGTFNADINLTTLAGATIDVRCRISDGEDTTSYTEEIAIVTVLGAYTVIGNITSIAPSNTTRDLVTSVTCNVASFGTIPSYQIIYDIDSYYNGAWHNLSRNFFNKALFDMALINYTYNVSFRCRATDGATTTNFTEGGNVTRRHKTNLIMFDRGNDEVIQGHKPYYKGLYADFYNEIGVSILSSYVDCNGDGFFDYYYTYNDSRNTTREHFLCYNREGIVKHTLGVFINKTNSSTAICGVGRIGTCRIQREYGVLIK